MKEQNGLNDRATDKDRIVVIGLDSYDVDLVERWSKEGRVPFLTSLMESGVWTRLISTRSLFGDSPWPSFNAGVSPAKHAWYSHLQIKRGTTEIERVNKHHYRYLPFWWLLRNAGKKVGVFDVPKTHPIEGIGGMQVAAWGEHYPLLKQSSLPPDLAKELSARFGKYRHPTEIVSPKRISQELRIYDTIISNIERKTRATEFLMAQEDWDLFITVFSEAHYAGHQFFHHFEKSHWAYDRKRALKLGDTLPNTCSRLDSAIATLLKGANDKATIFIVSVHGIETNYSGNHLMPTVLEKLGFQVRPESGSDAQGMSGVWDLSRALRDLIPRTVRDYINENIVPESFHDRAYSREFSSSIDWKRTKAFFLPSDHFQGFISVNLKGREPWGVIQTGAEYDEVCSQLCYELKRLVNPKTGTPAVRDVVQISKIYKGENLYMLPDVVIQWADDYIKQLFHPKFGSVSNEGFELRKSQHSADGFMIAAGRRINKAAALTEATTMDLAPTILYLLGETVPNDMDGNALLDLIDEDFRKNNEVKYGNRPLVVPEEMRL